MVPFDAALLCIPDKALYVAASDYCLALQKPLAGRTLLQVDQTESPEQKLFRYISQRGQNAGLDCRVRLRAGRDTQKGIESARESSPNSPKSEHQRIRESSNKSITHETASRFPRRRKLQPVEAIQFLTGQ